MEISSPRRGMAQSTMLLVLSAEAALFGTLVMSYLFLRTSGASSPFLHAEPVDLLIASLNTLVLLASAAFAWGAVREISLGNQAGLSANLLITLILGGVFVAGQIFEFNHSGLRIDGSIFSGAFFALISFHAVHVLAGMTVVALNLARTSLGDFNARRHQAITVGSWFWYFVVLVWIVLYIVLFLI